MKPIKVFYSFFILISVFLFNSCIKGDPPSPCYSFQLSTSFIDSITYKDLTGDIVFLPTIKYDKDSIRYKVISNYETTPIMKPTITSNTGFPNVFDFKYAFANTSNLHFGTYEVVFLLNSIDRDTIIINVINNYRLEYYYKNALIKNENGDCGYLNYTIKK